MYSIVNLVTRQMQSRVGEFQTKIERTIVPNYSERARLAAELGWLSFDKKIAEFERALSMSAGHNIPSARQFYDRERGNFEKIRKSDPLVVISSCLDKLLDVSNLPHSSHPLFRCCIASTYEWASLIAVNWPELKASKDLQGTIQRRSEHFMDGVLNLPGDVRGMSLLEMQAAFRQALQGAQSR